MRKPRTLHLAAVAVAVATVALTAAVARPAQALRALDGTQGGEAPFFSPDGEWIAFFSESKLRKIAVGGAALQTLADAPTAFQPG